MDNRKNVDLDSMNQSIEKEFQRVLEKDISLCIDIDADLSFYLGYFQCASELGIISEERFEDMADQLKEAFTFIWAS